MKDVWRSLLGGVVLATCCGAVWAQGPVAPWFGHVPLENLGNLENSRNLENAPKLPGGKVGLDCGFGYSLRSKFREPRGRCSKEATRVESHSASGTHLGESAINAGEVSATPPVPAVLLTQIGPSQADQTGKALPEPENLARSKLASAGVRQQPRGYRRPWAPLTYAWEPTALSHGPLYFEEPSLERYGQKVRFFQPVVTAAHFYATLPILPYKMGEQPLWESRYTLGHVRPGNHAPFHGHLPPLSVRGALTEAGTMTGLIYAIP